MPTTSAVSTPLYQSRFTTIGYDLLNALLWMPTGSDRLRRQLVASLALTPETRVLELVEDALQRAGGVGTLPQPAVKAAVITVANFAVTHHGALLQQALR